MAQARQTEKGRASLDNATNGILATRQWMLAQVAILDDALRLYGVEPPTDKAANSNEPQEPHRPVIA
jgi:hypothetical protein